MQGCEGKSNVCARHAQVRACACCTPFRTASPGGVAGLRNIGSAPPSGGTVAGARSRSHARAHTHPYTHKAVATITSVQLIAWFRGTRPSTTLSLFPGILNFPPKHISLSSYSVLGKVLSSARSTPRQSLGYSIFLAEPLGGIPIYVGGIPVPWFLACPIPP